MTRVKSTKCPYCCAVICVVFVDAVNSRSLILDLQSTQPSVKLSWMDFGKLTVSLSMPDTVRL